MARGSSNIRRMPAPKVTGAANSRTLTASLAFAGVVRRGVVHLLIAKLLPSGGGYYGTILADSPLSYWRLDETSGTTATDLVGGNSGTYTGTYTLGQGGALAGDSDTAVQFDGSTGYVALGDPAALEPAAVTVESWFKTTSTAGMVIARKRDGGYDLTIGGGDAGFGSVGQVAFAVYSSGSYRWASSSGTYNDGNWHHAVGTFDGSTIRVYVDGQQVAFTNWSGTITYFTGGSAIGRAGDFSGSYFAGTIDEAAIYDHALTPAQVLAHYNAGVGSGLKQATTRVLRAGASFVGALATARLKLLALAASLSFSGKSIKSTGHLLIAALSFGGSLKNATTKALNAGASFTGALTKATARKFSAALSFVGNLAMARLLLLTLTAAVSFAGKASRATQRGLVATLGFAGAVGKQTQRGLNASLSFTGNLLKRIGQSLLALLSFTGNTLKATSHKLTASLSFAGAIILTRLKVLALAASLSFSGRNLKAPGKALSAGLSFTGSTLKSTIKTALSGALGFTGAVTKATVHKAFLATLSFTGLLLQIRIKLLALTAALSLNGKILKADAKQLTGGLLFSGSLTKSASRSLTAVLSFTGKATKAVGHTFAGVLSFAGSIVKRIQPTLSAALSFAGKVSKQAASIKSGSISFVGRLPKSFTTLLSSALDLGGQMVKAITQKLNAILSFTGNFNAQQIKILVFNAVLGLSGTLQARIIKTLLLVAHLAFSGAVKRNTSKALTAALPLASRYMRATTKFLTSASLAFTGTLAKAKHHLYQLALAGSLRFTGITRRITHKLLLLVGGLRFAGRLQKGTHIALRAALAFHGFIRRNITHGMRSSLRFAGKVSKRSSIILRTVLRFTGRLPKSSATSFRATLRLGGQIRKATVKRFHPTLGFAGTIRQRLNKLLLFAAHLTFRGSTKRNMHKGLVAVLNMSGAMNSFAKIKALILFAVSKLKVKFFDNAAMLIETVEYDHEPYVPPVHDVLVAPSHSTMLIDQIVYEMDDGQLVARTTQEQLVRSDHPDLTITEAG